MTAASGIEILSICLIGRLSITITTKQIATIRTMYWIQKPSKILLAINMNITIREKMTPPRINASDPTNDFFFLPGNFMFSPKFIAVSYTTSDAADE